LTNPVEIPNTGGVIVRIQTLRAELGLSEGELLKLARQVCEDGALLSVAHLRQHQKFQLTVTLEQMLTEAAEMKLLTADLISQ
jgi:hypothetical protein